MNGMDSEKLIEYFEHKSGKYLKLENGEKVKLSAVIKSQWILTLTFTYNNKFLVIPFSGLYGEYVTMHIPEGLEASRYVSPIVKFDSLKSIGHAVEHVLTNWTERKGETVELINYNIDLEWE